MDSISQHASFCIGVKCCVGKKGKFMTKRDKGNQLRLDVSIPYSRESLCEKLSITKEWNAQLERRHRDNPFLLTVQVSDNEQNKVRTKNLIQLFCSSLEEGNCHVKLHACKVSSDIDVRIEADQVVIPPRRTIQCEKALTLKSLKTLSVQSPVSCPYIKLTSKTGQVRLSPEAIIRTKQIHTVGIKTFIEGNIAEFIKNQNNKNANVKNNKVDNLKSTENVETTEVKINVTGDLHIGRDANLGTDRTRRDGNLPVHVLNLKVGGDICNFGDIEAAEMIEIKCDNLKTCRSTKDDTAHRYLRGIEDRLGINEEHLSTGKIDNPDMHSAISSCNLQQIATLLRQREDVNAPNRRANISPSKQADKALSKSFIPIEKNGLLRDREKPDLAASYIKSWNKRSGSITAPKVFFHASETIEDASQIHGKAVTFDVGDDIIVEDQTIWTSGIIQGNCDGTVSIEGTAKLQCFNKLRVNTFCNTNIGICVVSTGGHLIIDNLFHNQSVLFHCKGQFIIETGIFQQDQRCTVESKQQLILRISKDSDEWYGSVKAESLLISVSANVAEDAEVIATGKCVIETNTNTNSEQQGALFHKGDINVSDGSLFVISKRVMPKTQKKCAIRKENPDVTSTGIITARGIRASSAFIKMASKSKTNIQHDIDPKNTDTSTLNRNGYECPKIYLLVGQLYTEKNSHLLFVTENRPMDIEMCCLNTWKHRGQLKIEKESQHDNKLHVQVSKFHNTGELDNIEFMQLEVLQCLINFKPISVKYHLEIAGGGDIYTRPNSSLHAREGPIDIHHIDRLHVSSNAYLKGKTITIKTLRGLNGTGTRPCKSDVLNKGVISSFSELLTIVAGNIKNCGTIDSQNDVRLQWTTTEKGVELGGFVKTPTLLTITADKTPMFTMKCFSGYSESADEFVLPKNGLVLECPLGFPVIDTIVTGKSAIVVLSNHACCIRKQIDVSNIKLVFEELIEFTELPTIDIKQNMAQDSDIASIKLVHAESMQCNELQEADVDNNEKEANNSKPKFFLNIAEDTKSNTASVARFDNLKSETTDCENIIFIRTQGKSQVICRQVVDISSKLVCDGNIQVPRYGTIHAHEIEMTRRSQCKIYTENGTSSDRRQMCLFLSEKSIHLNGNINHDLTEDIHLLLNSKKESISVCGVINVPELTVVSNEKITLNGAANVTINLRLTKAKVIDIQADASIKCHNLICQPLTDLDEIISKYLHIQGKLQVVGSISCRVNEFKMESNSCLEMCQPITTAVTSTNDNVVKTCKTNENIAENLTENYSVENPNYNESQLNIEVDESAYIAGQFICSRDLSYGILSCKEELHFVDNFTAKISTNELTFCATKMIKVDPSCDIAIHRGKVCMTNARENEEEITGDIVLSGHFIGKNESFTGENTTQSQVSNFEIEGKNVTLKQLSIEKVNTIECLAAMTLSIDDKSCITQGSSVNITVTTLEHKGEISKFEKVNSNVDNMLVLGKIIECGEIRIDAELAAFNSGHIQGQKTGISSPIYMNCPPDFDGQTASSSQLGGDEQKELIIEGLLCIIVGSELQGKNINIKSILQFEFASQKSTVPGSSDLDRWKSVMDNSLSKISDKSGDYSGIKALVEQAMKIKEVICKLGVASHMCQDIVALSQKICKGGLSEFKMDDLLGSLNKAHSEYSMISSVNFDFKVRIRLRRVKNAGKRVAKNLMNKMFGQKSFSETLEFRSIDGEIEEGLDSWTFINIGEDIDITTRGNITVLSLELNGCKGLWKNEGHIEACGDICISASMIKFRGHGQGRLMKAVMGGINLQADNIDVENTESRDLNVEAKNTAHLNSTKSTDATNIKATNADISNADGSSLHVNTEKSTRLDNADFDKEISVQAGTNVKVSNTKSKRLDVRAKSDIDIKNIKTNTTLSALSEVGNIKGSQLKAEEGDINLKGCNVDVENTESNNLNVFAKNNADLKSTTSTDATNIKATSAYIYNAEGSSLHANTEKSTHLDNANFDKEISIKAGTNVEVSNTKSDRLDVRATSDIDMKNVKTNTALRALSEDGNIKGSQLKAEEGDINLKGCNVDIENTESKNLNVEAKNTADLKSTKSTDATNIKATHADIYNAEGSSLHANTEKSTHLDNASFDKEISIKAGTNVEVSNTKSDRLDVRATSDIDMKNVKTNTALSALSEAGNIKGSQLKAEEGDINLKGCNVDIENTESKNLNVEAKNTADLKSTKSTDATNIKATHADIYNADGSSLHANTEKSTHLDNANFDKEINIKAGTNVEVSNTKSDRLDVRATSDIDMTNVKTNTALSALSEVGNIKGSQLKAEAGDINLKGCNVDVENTESKNLNVFAKNIADLKSTTSTDATNIKATSAYIYNAEGSSLHANTEKSTHIDNANFDKEINIKAGTNVEVSNTKSDRLDVRATSDIDIKNVKTNTALSALSEVGNIKGSQLKAEEGDINLKGCNVDIENTESKNLNVEAKNTADLKSTKSTDATNIKATHADIYNAEGSSLHANTEKSTHLDNANFDKEISIKAGTNVEVSNTKSDRLDVRATSDIDMKNVKTNTALSALSEAGNIKGSQLKAEEGDINIKGCDVDVENTDSRNLNVEAKSTAYLKSVKSTDATNIHAKQAEIKNVKANTLCVDATDIARVDNANVDTDIYIKAKNKAEILNTTSDNLVIDTEGDINMGNNETHSELSAVSKTGNITVDSKIKANKAHLSAEEGNISLTGKSGKANHIFGSLTLKTKEFQDINKLLNKDDLYKDLKISDSLGLIVEDQSVVLANSQKLQHSLTIQAASIDVRGNLESSKSINLEATKSSLNIDHGVNVKAGENVSLMSKGNVTLNSGSNVVAGENVYVESTAGSVNVISSKITAGKTAAFFADKDINITAQNNEDGTATKSVVKAGSGDSENNDPAISMVARRDLSIHASDVTSTGENVFKAKRDINITANTYQTVEYEKKSSCWGLKTETTTTTTTHVEHSSITGKSNTFSAEGNFTSKAGQIHSDMGTKVHAKGGVNMLDIVARTEVEKTTKLLGGLLYQKNETARSEQSHGTLVQYTSALSNTEIISDTSDITWIGSSIKTQGNLKEISKRGKVTHSKRILNNSVNTTECGFYFSGTGYGYKVNTSNNYFQTTSDDCMEVGGNCIIEAKEFAALNSFDVNVQNDMTIDAKRVRFEGASLHSTNSNFSFDIGVEMTSVRVGVEYSQGWDTTQQAQTLYTGGKLKLVGTKDAIFDNCEADVEKLEGEVENMEVISRADTHSSFDVKVGIGFDGATETPELDIGGGYCHSKRVNQASAINVRSGSKGLSVKNLSLTGAAMVFDGDVHDFASKIVSHDVHESFTDINASLSICKPKPKKIKGSVSLGVQHSHGRFQSAIGSKNGKIDESLKRKVNTDLEKQRVEDYKMGFSFSAKFEGKPSKVLKSVGKDLVKAVGEEALKACGENLFKELGLPESIVGDIIAIAKGEKTLEDVAKFAVTQIGKACLPDGLAEALEAIIADGNPTKLITWVCVKIGIDIQLIVQVIEVLRGSSSNQQTIKALIVCAAKYLPIPEEVVVVSNQLLNFKDNKSKSKLDFAKPSSLALMNSKEGQLVLKKLCSYLNVPEEVSNIVIDVLTQTSTVDKAFIIIQTIAMNLNIPELFIKGLKDAMLKKDITGLVDFGLSRLGLDKSCSQSVIKTMNDGKRIEDVISEVIKCIAKCFGIGDVSIQGIQMILAGKKPNGGPKALVIHLITDVGNKKQGQRVKDAVFKKLENIFLDFDMPKQIVNEITALSQTNKSNSTLQSVSAISLFIAKKLGVPKDVVTALESIVVDKDPAGMIDWVAKAIHMEDIFMLALLSDVMNGCNLKQIGSNLIKAVAKHYKVENMELISDIDLVLDGKKPKHILTHVEGDISNDSIQVLSSKTDFDTKTKSSTACLQNFARNTIQSDCAKYGFPAEVVDVATDILTGQEPNESLIKLVSTFAVLRGVPVHLATGINDFVVKRDSNALAICVVEKTELQRELVVPVLTFVRNNVFNKESIINMLKQICSHFQTPDDLIAQIENALTRKLSPKVVNALVLNIGKQFVIPKLRDLAITLGVPHAIVEVIIGFIGTDNLIDSCFQLVDVLANKIGVPEGVFFAIKDIFLNKNYDKMAGFISNKSGVDKELIISMFKSINHGKTSLDGVNNIPMCVARHSKVPEELIGCMQSLIDGKKPSIDMKTFIREIITTICAHKVNSDIFGLVLNVVSAEDWMERVLYFLRYVASRINFPEECVDGIVELVQKKDPSKLIDCLAEKLNIKANLLKILFNAFMKGESPKVIVHNIAESQGIPKEALAVIEEIIMQRSKQGKCNATVKRVWTTGIKFDRIKALGL